MSTAHFLQRIDQLHTLIQKESTGTRHELADHLGISVSTLHNSLNFMMDELEAPIKYDAVRKTYYYTEPGTIQIMFRRINVSLAADIIDYLEGKRK